MNWNRPIFRTVVLAVFALTAMQLSASQPEWANNDKKDKKHWEGGGGKGKGHAGSGGSPNGTVPDSGSGIVLLALGLGTLAAVKSFEERGRKKA